MHMYRLMPFAQLKSKEGFDEKQLFGNFFFQKNNALIQYTVHAHLHIHIYLDIIGRVVHLHAPQEKLINGKNSRLIDFVIEDKEYVYITSIFFIYCFIYIFFTYKFCHFLVVFKSVVRYGTNMCLSLSLTIYLLLKNHWWF